MFYVDTKKYKGQDSFLKNIHEYFSTLFDKSVFIHYSVESGRVFRMVSLMNRQSFRTGFASFLLVLGMILSGCSKKEPPLVVLTTGENAPFSMKDEKGELSGFDIDLIRMIAASMNRELELKCVPFDSIIDDIRTKRADMAIGSISITEDRTNLVDFSPAYHHSGFSLVMLGTTSSNLKDLSNKMIAVRKGTWQERAVKTTWADLPNLFVQSFDHLTINDIITKLRNGEVCAVIVDNDEANYIVNRNADLKIVALDVGTLGMGIITSQNSIYSQPVKDFIERHSNEIHDLEVKWFHPVVTR